MGSSYYRDAEPSMEESWWTDMTLSGDRVGSSILPLVSSAHSAAVARKGTRWNPAADLNGDGIVNFWDFQLLLLGFQDPACR